MPIKLLIAEDEDMIRNGMERYIRSNTDLFDKIYLACNGQEALDIIFQHKPDIMLLDVQMPVKNGVEVMREAKKMDILPLTVILSGHDEFIYAQKAIKYGAREYLLKPTRSSDILSCLNKLVNELTGKSVKESGIVNPHYAVEHAKEYMEEHYHKDITLQSVAEVIGISPGYLSTLFSQDIKCGFVDYLNQYRVEQACVYLEQNYLKTYEIAYRVGFRDEKYFSKVFKKIKGISPSEYRKKHKT